MIDYEEHHKPRPDAAVKKGRRSRIFIWPMGLAFVIMLLAVGLGANINLSYSPPSAQEDLVRSEAFHKIAQEVENYVYQNATALVKDAKYQRIPELDQRLNDNIAEFLEDNFQPYPQYISGAQFYVQTIRLSLVEEPGLAPALSPDCRVNAGSTGTGANNSLDTTLPISEPVSVAPVFVKVDGSLIVEARSKEGKVTLNHTFSKRLPFPLPLLRDRLRTFESQGEGRQSAVGRMVNYMLTTLVRYRTLQDVNIGMTAEESSRNLLNEGDVELAVNLAVLLWEMQVFRDHDEKAAAAIDRYFYDVSKLTRADVYDPTGLRPWGEAETQNYKDHYLPARKNINVQGRTLVSLVSDYCYAGYLDPADLLAYYLCLDEQLINGQLTINPNDALSILSAEKLFNARYPFDYFDLLNLETMLYLDPQRYLELRTTEANRSADYTDAFEVVQEPEYLICGRDITVTGIYPPKAWMSNVIMTLEDSKWHPDLGTRCGTFPPGQRPTDHDWRLFWNMTVAVDFELTVTEDRKTFKDDFFTQGCSARERIVMEFPVDIYVWLYDLPKGDSNIFENLNAGGMIPTLNGTYWVISPEADAMEYIDAYIWHNLRPLNSLQFDAATAILGEFGSAEQDDPDSELQFVRELTDIMYWKAQRDNEIIVSYAPVGEIPFEQTPWYNLYRFINTYILNPYVVTWANGTDIQIDWSMNTDKLKPQTLDGANVTVKWVQATDQLTIDVRYDELTFRTLVKNVRDNATREVLIRTEINTDGLSLEFVTHPLNASCLPDLEKATLFGRDLVPFYSNTSLASVSGWGEDEAAQTCMAVELRNIEFGSLRFDAKVILPSDMASPKETSEAIPVGGSGAKTQPELAVILSAISNVCEVFLQSGPQAAGDSFDLGFENVNSGSSLYLRTDLAGLSGNESANACNEILSWMREHGPRAIYMLGVGVASLDAYACLLEEVLSFATLSRVSIMLSRPYAGGMYMADSLTSERYEFSGTVLTNDPQGGSMFFGIGANPQHLAPSGYADILTGRFLVAGENLRTGCTIG